MDRPTPTLTTRGSTNSSHRERRLTLPEIITLYNDEFGRQPANLEFEIKPSSRELERYTNEERRQLWLDAYQRLYERSQAESGWITVCGGSMRMINVYSDAIQWNYGRDGPIGKAAGMVKTRIGAAYVREFLYALSTEVPIPTAELKQVSEERFGGNKIDRIRYRIRTGYTVPELPGWRIDLTYVKTTKTPDPKDREFFPAKLTAVGIPQHVTSVDRDRSVEIELEYLNGAPLTEAEVQRAVDWLHRTIWPNRQTQQEYGRVIQHLARTLDQRSSPGITLKQLVNNPITLDLRTYQEQVYPHLEDYYLTEKADGMRAWLVIGDERFIGLGLGSQHITESETESKPKRRAWLITQSILDVTDVLGGTLDTDCIIDLEWVPQSAMISKGKATSQDKATSQGKAPPAPATKPKAKPKPKAKTGKSDLDVLRIDPDPLLQLEEDLPAREAHPTGGVDGGMPERYTDKPSELHLYAFDLVWYGEAYAGRSYTERLAALTALQPKLGRLQIKRQIRLTAGHPEDIGEHYASKMPYHIDGLILSYGAATYWKPASVYKWKPPEQLTIDFLVMQAPPKLTGMPPYTPRKGYTMFLLYCGANPDQIQRSRITPLPVHDELFSGVQRASEKMPIQFVTPRYPLAFVYYHKDGSDPPTSALSGHVAEFLALLDQPVETPGMVSWRLVKMRPDRDENVRRGVDFGNAMNTAYTNFQALLQPLTIEQMSTVPTVVPVPLDASGQSATGYFAQDKASQYRNLTYYDNWVKANILQMVAGAGRVLDLGIGKGQDLFKYSGWGVSELIGVDADADALEQLERRVLELDSRQWYVYPPKPPRPQLRVRTLQCDLTQGGLPALLTQKRIIRGGDLDAVVSNLSIHYWVQQTADIKRLREILDGCLKIGGHFLCTTFNGQMIYQLLGELKQGAAWNWGPKGEVRYSIKKGYSSGQPFQQGLPIEVIHPFSAGQYYPEHLMSFDGLVSALAPEYALVARGSFLDYHSRYEDWGRVFQHHHQLDEWDRAYAGLYGYLGFLRVA